MRSSGSTGNAHPPRASRKLGKFIFIVILSIVSAVVFHSDMAGKIETGGEPARNTETDYFDRQPAVETEPSSEEPIWLSLLLLFTIYVGLFTLYELSGMLAGWAAGRTRRLFFQEQLSGRAGGTRRTIFVRRSLEQKLQEELEDGEKITWMAQPIPRFFVPSSTAAFLFAIPWTAFAVFWMFGASHQSGLGFGMFGLPFVLVGIAMLSSPLWAYYKTRSSIYAITDQRAFVIDGGWSATVRSYPPYRLQNIFRRDRKNGTGDIIFSHEMWQDSDGKSQKTDLGFLNIRDPKPVQKMLTHLAAQYQANHPE